MEIDNTFLKLLSESFKEKLEILKEKHDDKVAAYLIEADNLILYYSQYYKDIPSSDNTKDINKKIYDYFVETINKTITQYCRQITLKKDAFEVSFLPKYCTPVYTSNGNWDKKNRQSGKPGKIIQKLIGEGVFKNADYEQFVYRLKAIWSTGGYDLQLVKGEDIRYWYNDENYYKRTNTLGHSCMSNPDCSEFFDLYCEQPECQMLIALKDGKLAARALVWTIDDKTFMDRVYYCEDSLFNILTNFAKENKWYIRESNGLLSDGDDQYFKGPEDNYDASRSIQFCLKLKRFYEYFPYIDSFRYLDLEQECLRTYMTSGNKIRECSFTDGRFDEDQDSDFYDDDDDDEDEVYCENCDSRLTGTTILVSSNYYNIVGCTRCMSYSFCMEDYIPNDLAIEVRCLRLLDIACAPYLADHPELFVNINGLWYTKEYAAEQGLITEDEQN